MFESGTYVKIKPEAKRQLTDGEWPLAYLLGVTDDTQFYVIGQMPDGVYTAQPPYPSKQVIVFDPNDLEAAQ